MNHPLPALDPTVSQPDAAPAYSPDQGARLHHARLVMRDGRRYAALTGAGAIWVTPAAGCLLQPEVGDMALISVAAGQGYILTVLERGAPASAARVEVPGDLQLSLPEGKLTIQAAEGVALDAGPTLEINAEHATVTLDEADLRYRTLNTAGDTAHTQWNTRTDVSVNHLEIANRAEVHLGQSMRRVAGHEDVAAGSQRTVVNDDWSVHAATADLKARDRVAVDAGSVQIG
ncbi:DUF3540 domain-containing protein [Achromobacter spanius]|uniref:DUF3540 domain-containing protein n=1 Tax=Achromobacter spanius TaxID=217203 RepID=UPI0013DE9392|nr:DUF3540 domain-containing protein [Achromobacter spanius]